MRLATVGMVIDQPVSIHYSYGVPVIVTGMNRKWYTDIVKRLENSISEIDLGQAINFNNISPNVVKESGDFIYSLIEKGCHEFDESIEKICNSSGVSVKECKNNIYKYPKINIQVAPLLALVLVVGVTSILLGTA